MIKIFIVGWRGVSNDKIADIVKTDHQLDKANVSDNIVAGGQQSDEEVAASASSPEVRKPNIPLWLRVETPNLSIWPMIK